jgi:UDP-4-amino-4,6-dideoxy-N-acetyl-beta-L-altrosamine N-acetyltransferase
MASALRPLTESDSETLLRWRNSREVARFMYNEHEISLEEHTAWLKRALSRDDASYFVITLDGADVGLVSVTEIDPRHGTCSWAIYVGEVSARARSVGAFATYSILEHVFGERELRKVSCEVLVSNPAALALYERFGFVHEGRFREQIVKPEGPVDVLRLGILEREWAELRDGHRQRLVEEGVLKD